MGGENGWELGKSESCLRFFNLNFENKIGRIEICWTNPMYSSSQPSIEDKDMGEEGMMTRG